MVLILHIKTECLIVKICAIITLICMIYAYVFDIKRKWHYLCIEQINNNKTL